MQTYTKSILLVQYTFTDTVEFNRIKIVDLMSVHIYVCKQHATHCKNVMYRKAPEKRNDPDPILIDNRDPGTIQQLVWYPDYGPTAISCKKSIRQTTRLCHCKTNGLFMRV